MTETERFQAMARYLVNSPSPSADAEKFLVRYWN